MLYNIRNLKSIKKFISPLSSGEPLLIEVDWKLVDNVVYISGWEIVIESGNQHALTGWTPVQYVLIGQTRSRLDVGHIDDKYHGGHRYSSS